MIKSIKHRGMMLIEVLFAVSMCAILMGLCIYVFKTKDMSRSAYIYSFLTNLKEAQTTVIEDCYKEGNCSDLSTLPDSVNEYCSRLANSLIVTGDVNCTEVDTFEGANAERNYINNFRLSNGVSLYNLNNTDWQTLAIPGGATRKYIDVFIDIDGKDKGSNNIGSDIFPIRIFKDGEIIPSHISEFKTGEIEVQPYNDSEFFAYRVVLNKAKADNKNARYEEVVNMNGALRGENNLQSDKPREAVSFREAVCRTDSSLLSRYYTSDELTDINCDDFKKNGVLKIISVCDFADGPNAADKSAYCSIEAKKPQSTGFLKLLGI